MKKLVKHEDAQTGTLTGGGKTPKKAVPAKKALAPTTSDKGPVCFDGASDLHPTRSKVGQTKKR